jgi:CHAT domain-containing protein/tetratricopeptide (TPR) repeat protein
MLALLAVIAALLTGGEARVQEADKRVALETAFRDTMALVARDCRLARYREAARSLKSALAICDKLHPRQDHVELAECLSNLGHLLWKLGEPRKALPHYERALAVVERMHPAKDHAHVAMALSALGSVLLALGEPARARPYYERALAMAERLYPKQDRVEVATCLTNLARVLEDQGQAARAVPYGERALAMRRRLHPEQAHPELAKSLNNMGRLLEAVGELDRARRHGEQALAMYERLYPGQDHSEFAIALNNRAHLLEVLGEPRKALPYCRRALAMRQRLHPDRDHPEVAVSLNNMGTLHQALGELRLALDYGRRALAMRQRLHAGKDHIELTRCFNNVALLLQKLGEPVKALPYYERALAMSQRLHGQGDDSDLAGYLGNVAGLLLALGEPGKALPYGERSLAMRQRLHPRGDDGGLAKSLNNMGAVLAALGQPRKALPYYERALAMQKRLHPEEDSSELALSLYNLGSLLVALGEMRQARPYLQRAQAMCERLHPGKDHPLLVNIHGTMAELLLTLGQQRQALRHLERAAAISRRHVEDLSAYAPEAEALAFVALQRRVRDRLLSLTHYIDDSDAATYSHLWHAKAAVTRVLERRHLAARAARDRKTREAWFELADTRRQLARLLLQPIANREARDREANRLTERKETLERDLAERLPEGKRPRGQDQQGPAELSRRLPAGAAYLDFVRYVGLGLDSSKPGPRTLRYAAFVLVKGRPVKRVELGPARPIDEALTSWRRAISAWRADLAPGARQELITQAERQGRQLRRQLWARLGEHLPAGCTTLYLCPDGDLARLPWAALPAGTPGKVLLDDYRLAVVPHGPFLLAQLSGGVRAPRRGDSVVVYGGVDYAPATLGKWPKLPGTERERQCVCALAATALETRPLCRSGRAASTAQLLADLPKARYAHLATHGFFAAEQLSEERRRLLGQLKTWEYRPGQVTQGVGVGVRSPLAYTGLVLAGANVPDRVGADGGVVTGEALVELPLEGLRLCVLSACETGLGALTEGEGVRGLVRAFHLAGCPDVVASLWQVEDRATAALMTRFYHELWVNKKSPIEALREAQLLVSRRPDLVGDLAGERGLARQEKAVRVNTSTAPNEAAGKERLPPKLWAAFLLSGLGR